MSEISMAMITQEIRYARQRICRSVELPGFPALDSLPCPSQLIYWVYSHVKNVFHAKDLQEFSNSDIKIIPQPKRPRGWAEIHVAPFPTPFLHYIPS